MPKDGKTSIPGDINDMDLQDDDLSTGELALEKRYSPQTVSTLELLDERLIPVDLIIKLLENLCLGASPRHASVLVFLPGLREILNLADLLESNPLFNPNIFRLFPLHSTLSSDTQNSVFDTLPYGMTKIVLGKFAGFFPQAVF